MSPEALLKSNGVIINAPVEFNPFGLRSLGDAIKAEPLPYLVQGMLHVAEIMVLAGQPGTGKTFLGLSLGAAIASDTEFMGRGVLPGLVVYGQFEGTGGTGRRGKALLKQNPALADAPLYFITRNVTVDTAPQLVVMLQELVAKHGPLRLLVIDTLTRAYDGKPQNDDAEASLFLNAMDKVRDALGCAILIIHHTPKSAENLTPAGSRVLMGNPDAVAIIEGGAGQTKRVNFTKMKEGDPEEASFAFDLRRIELDETDEYGEARTSCVVVPVDMASTRRRRTPSGNAGIVYRALQEALGQAGTASPGSNHIPASATVTTHDTWRRIAYSRLPAENTDAKKKAFQRAATQLADLGRVGTWNEFVWVAE